MNPQDELSLLRERTRRLESLFSVSSQINSTLDLNELLRLILKTSEQLMDAEASSFLLLDEIKQELYFEVARGESAGALQTQIRLKMGQGIAGWVAQSGQPRLVVDAYSDPQFNPEADRRTGFRTRTIVCVPLKVNDRLIGVGQVINKKSAPAFSQSDLEFFTIFCGMAAVAIDNARLHLMMLEKQGLDRELQLAHTIQQHFLPQRFPQHPQLEFAAQNYPAKNVGGDVYDVIPLPRNRFGVLIGDVSGKGVHAALYASKLISDFRHLAREDGDPAKALLTMNQQLLELDTPGMFATLLYMIFDPEKQQVQCANAGHIPPFWIDATQHKVQMWDGDGGPPLGMTEQCSFPVYSMPLQGDGFFTLVTDGITEARNRDGEAMGLEVARHFLETILKRKDFNANEVIDYCVEGFQARGRIQSDDITMVVVKYGDWGLPNPSPKPEVHVQRIKSDPQVMPEVRQWIEGLCRRAGFSMPETQILILAVDEACTNIIRYAYGGDITQDIVVRVVLTPQSIEFRLRDFGKKADPATFCRIKKDPLEPGGLGCEAMSRAMDVLEYHTALPHGTELSMMKYRKA